MEEIKYRLTAIKQELVTANYGTESEAVDAAQLLSDDGYQVAIHTTTIITTFPAEEIKFTVSGRKVIIEITIHDTSSDAWAAAELLLVDGYRVEVEEITVLTEDLPVEDRSTAYLLFSPAANRGSAIPLDGGYIAADMPVAIFVRDVPVIGITSVDFKLDGVSQNVENSAPWDYAQTDGLGNANRVTFTPGFYTVDAEITDAEGTFTVSASFEVE